MLMSISRSPSIALRVACWFGMLSLAASPTQAQTTDPGADGQALFLGVFFGQGEAARQLPQLWSPTADRERRVQVERYFADRGIAVSVDPTDTRLVNRAAMEALAAEVQNAASITSRQGETERAETLTRLAAVIDGLSDQRLDTMGSLEVFTSMVVSYLNSADATFFSRFGAALRSGSVVRVDHAMREAGRQLIDLFALFESTNVPMPGTGNFAANPSGLLCIDTAVVGVAVAVVFVAGVVAAYKVVHVAAVKTKVVFWDYQPNAPSNSNLERSEFVADLTVAFKAAS